MIGVFLLRARHWQIFLGFAAVFFLDIMLAAPPLPRLSWICYLLWFYVMGSSLNSVVHPELRPRQTFFRLISLYMFALTFLFDQIFFWSRTEPAVLLVLICLAIVCDVYILYFLAKNFSLAEAPRPQTFSDLIGPFLLFWFYPLGIWFLQPRINKLYEAALDEMPQPAQN